MALLGLQAELGAQVTDLVGIYVEPSLDLLGGPAWGLNLSGTAMVDVTLLDGLLTLGGGLDLGGFLAVGVNLGPNSSTSAAGGLVYGARTRIALNLMIDRSAAPRRSAFTIALETRFLTGPAAAATEYVSGTSTGGSSASALIISPQLTLGFSLF